MISYTSIMCNFQTDTYTGATPLAALKAGEDVNILDMVIGRTAGTIGETSMIAIVIGACFLILLGVIDLRIPGTYLVENFKSLVANQNLGLAMANSFRNAILMTLITLLVCSIAGKKLGIIGLGAIGVKVANAAVGLDMEVWGYDPYLSVDGALKLDRSVKHVTELDEIFANCDYITIHVPLNADTKNTISAEAIEKMKDGVRVINLARGELVDTKAMAKALESGKVAAYVSDFASDEILEQENAITLPHLGASTPESEDNCAKMAVYEITEYLEKGTIRNSVNFPNLKVPYEGGYRICMIHKNIPNMIASITSAVRCNIENMGNRSKGDYAYTIIDTAEAPTEANLDELRAIEGMISVRTI